MDVFIPRIDRLNRYTQNNGAQALLITDPVDLLYITGIKMSTGIVVLYEDHPVLLVDKRYFEHCVKRSPIPVKPIEEFPLKVLLKTDPYKKIEKLGFDSGKTSFHHYHELLKEIPQCTLVPLGLPVVMVRAIKDATELDLLRRAAVLGSEGYEHVVSLLKTGVTELDLAIALEIFWKKQGADGLGFDPIIAFGPNSSMPHYRPQNVPLQKGDTVLIDIGVKLDGYHSDMTRVVFFGEPSPKMKELYEVVLKAQEKTVNKVAPGITTGELDKIARDSIAADGYGELFTHGLGHGVGLDIHEKPVLKSNHPESGTVLQPGMVLTVEPGVYLPDVGGIRIEDTVIVTEEGKEIITAVSKKIRIIPVTEESLTR